MRNGKSACRTGLHPERCTKLKPWPNSLMGPIKKRLLAQQIIAIKRIRYSSACFLHGYRTRSAMNCSGLYLKFSGLRPDLSQASMDAGPLSAIHLRSVCVAHWSARWILAAACHPLCCFRIMSCGRATGSNSPLPWLLTCPPTFRIPSSLAADNQRTPISFAEAEALGMYMQIP